MVDTAKVAMNELILTTATRKPLTVPTRSPTPTPAMMPIGTEPVARSTWMANSGATT